MKRSLAVKKNRQLYRNVVVAPVVASLFSILIVRSGLLVSGNELAYSEVLGITPSTQHVVAPPSDKLSVRDAAHVAILSEMIEDTTPDHPDKKAIASLIVRESRRAQLDPLFVAAVVHAESRFKHQAISSRGAQGLMQIMPETGRYVAKLSNIELKGNSSLHNPETNIKIGVSYLKHLFNKFKGNREQILVAYNWGPANLLRALSSGSAFPEESKKYVRKVMAEHATWSARLTQYAAAARSTTVG